MFQMAVLLLYLYSGAMRLHLASAATSMRQWQTTVSSVKVNPSLLPRTSRRMATGTVMAMGTDASSGLLNALPSDRPHLSSS